MSDVEVLLIGCPNHYSKLLPPRATPCVSYSDSHTTSVDPRVTVIGEDVAKPLVLAQRLSRRYPSALLLIVAAPDQHPLIVEKLQTTPYVPVSTRIVANTDDEVRSAVQKALARSEVQRRHRSIERRVASASATFLTPVVEGRTDPIDPARSLMLDSFLEFCNQHRSQLVAALSTSRPENPMLDGFGRALLSEQHLQWALAVEPGQTNGVYQKELQRWGRQLVDAAVTPFEWFRFMLAMREAVSTTVRQVAYGDPANMEELLRGHLAFFENIEEAVNEGYVHAEVRNRRAFDQRQRLFSSVVESSAAAILSISTTGTITSWNGGAQTLFGYSEEEAIGMNVNVLAPPDRFAEQQNIIQRIAGGVKTTFIDTKRIRRDGTEVDVTLAISPIFGPDEIVVGASTIARDITERIRTVRALEEQSQKLAAMLNGALDAVVTIDHEGHVVEFNPAAQALFGYTAAESVGRPLADLIIPERLREQHRRGMSNYVSTGVHTILGQRIELPALHRSGQEFPIEVSIVRLVGFEPPMFTGFIRDLTALKRAQKRLEKTVEGLKRSNQDLEQFAYMASHDLQEPLRMVTSYMELFSETYRHTLDERADKYVHFAVDGARRMKKLIDDLLTYSRVDTQAKPLEECDLGELLLEVVADMSLRIQELKADVVVGKLPVVWADAGQLALVFQNLIGNAIKFCDRTDPRVSINAALHGDNWRFVVEDNGVGFESRDATRIFQMFQRLHGRSAYEGSGIGLAIAKRIVERHHGRIWAESTPGEGSRFYFELPAHRVLRVEED